MKFLFDTDHITFLQLRSGPEFAAITGRMALHAPTDFAASFVSFHEQSLGANAYLNRAATAAAVIRGYVRIREVFESYMRITRLTFDAAAATIFDGLRTQRIRIGTMDLRIAAIAMSQNLVVLTRNSSDFSQVPGLTIEDWTV